MRISPPTASKLLDYHMSQNLLKKESYKNYLLFYANKESDEFIDLSRIYWRIRLREVVSFLERELTNPTIVLFGSLSKAEVKPDSDADLAIFAVKKSIDFGNLEKVAGRKIQAFWFESLSAVKSEELANNILNGYTLAGRLSI